MSAAMTASSQAPSGEPDCVMRIIEIAFWNENEARLAYDAIEKLLGEMGEIGQMSMHTLGVSDENP